MRRPGCMTADEWERWQEPIIDKDRITSPCAFCPSEWHVQMTAEGRCDSQPIHINGRPRLESSAQLERRRAQWRAYRARKRAGNCASPAA
jgi:hypothetical protein